MLKQQSHCYPQGGNTRERGQKSNCVARALYDNIAEAPDEIAFRKGDMLTVLEQNTNGLEGWWLCCLRGRQGIAPGNRLRILPGVYDPTGLGYAGGPANHTAPGTPVLSSVPPPPQSQNSDGGCTTPGTPRHARRRSWHSNQNKVVMPQRIGDVYLYDTPLNGARVARHPDEIDSVIHQRNLSGMMAYDVPIGSKAGSYDTPPSPRVVKQQQQHHNNSTYDHPRSQSLPIQQTLTYDIPRSIHDYDLPSNSPDSKQGTYDVPLSHQIITSSDNYVIPKSQLMHKKGHLSTTPSNRSSGVSVMTSSSPSLSPACSQSSLNASLSLSSLGGSNRSSLEQPAGDLYDIPPSDPRPINLTLSRASPLSTIIPPPLPQTNTKTSAGEVYDIPLNNTQVYDTPPMPRPAVSAKTRPVILDGVYDVPPQVTRDISPEKNVPQTEDERRLSSSSTDSKELPPLAGKELPIDLDAAMEILVNVHQEVVSSNTKLFSFVSSTWRKREEMDSKMYDIKLTCLKLGSSLKEFLKFAQGALANSANAQDKSLAHKLAKLIRPLADSDAIVQAAVQSLEERGWQIVKFTQEDTDSPDELDQLVACARGLVEDVRQVASFIQGNSPLIFKRSKLISDVRTDKPAVAPKPVDLQARILGLTSPSKAVQDRPLPPLPPNMITNKKEEPKKQTEQPETDPPVNDYDYVSLEPKESVEQQKDLEETVKLKSQREEQLAKSVESLVIKPDDQVVKTEKMIKREAKTSVLDFGDKQILRFYSLQMDKHMTFLNKSIDSFFEVVKNNQPPKVFVAHVKFVAIGAEKLVNIGDTINRNARNVEVKAIMAQCANAISSAINVLVGNTKNAALQFPSVEAVQTMVDSVVDLSHLANEIKQRIALAANW